MILKSWGVLKYSSPFVRCSCYIYIFNFLNGMNLWLLKGLRVHLVGGVEKWEDRKDFNFPHFCLVRSCWYRIFSTLDLRAKPQKSKNIIFSPWVCKSIQDDVAQPVRALKHLKCLFSAKMTKIPLVSPKFDQRPNKVQTLAKQHF